MLDFLTRQTTMVFILGMLCGAFLILLAALLRGS
jgi:hypothetical protein